MENASKALIIAGSVFLTIMVASVGTYLMARFQGSTDTYLQSLDTAQIVKYNSNFEIYANTSKKITAQEIVTLIEFAKKSNLGTNVFVKESTGGYVNRTTEPFNTDDFLKKNILRENEAYMYNLFKYNANSIKYNSQGIVSEIRFYYKDKEVK